MKVTPLASCVACGVEVPASLDVVKKQIAHPHGVLVIFECPKCDTIQQVLMLPHELRQRAEQRKHSNAELDKRRQIGVLVKGFSVDLEAVESVSDLELYWDYQERNMPGTIVIEDEVCP